MSSLARANLSQRRTRTALSIVAVAFEVALVLVLVGLVTGTLGEYSDRIEGMQSDIILLPPGAQMVLSLNSAVMPLEPVRRLLHEIPGVSQATPIVVGTTSRFGGYSMIWGIELESFNATGRGLKMLEGEAFQGPNDLIVDRLLAKANALTVGDTIELINTNFRISGICEEGAGVRIYMPIETIQALLGRHQKASVFFIQGSSPDQSGPVAERLEKHPAFKAYTVVESKKYAEILGTTAPAVSEFIGAVTAIAVFFGFLVISLSLYTTIIERTRQIGILKSLGASHAFIVRTVVEECVILCGLGILVGLALALGIKELMMLLHPTVTILITARWMLTASALAILGGLLGALYPAWRAARVDPIQALQYE